ncbi:MAG: hypothetical protein AVDCRST_MAG77-4267 [uncultured Chloroflexi bacterium]|uniref:Cyclic nucleotide-binding domain-containing protein n=1 Tax=uncultured Chloroflexota bacterium TaxID=166587 RepID=A0A6J4JK04_9CHLR|nr:MAG: hypothetical protein AVDCRST_MAG77-4267 [uncultured Chloroflexota bacterium]
MVSQLEQPATVARSVPAMDGASALSLPPGVDFSVVLRAPLFRELTPEQVTRFLALGTARTVTAGEEIIAEGNTDTDTFVILRGKVDVLKKLPPVLPGGAEQQKSIVQLTAPMMGIFAMGAPNMLGGLGRSATVAAVEDCDAIVVSKEAYERLCREDPLLGYFMTRNIAMQIIKDLNDTNARVVKLTQALTLALQKRQ